MGESQDSGLDPGLDAWSNKALLTNHQERFARESRNEAPDQKIGLKVGESPPPLARITGTNQNKPV
jgi:hypothetical protein